MPYSLEHKKMTRKRIVEAARIMFNRHGFEGVSIDMIMEQAGLTRGGFYNHFKDKETLYGEAVKSFLTGRGAQWRADAGVNEHEPTLQDARLMLRSYLSDMHLGDIDGQCPMIALPSDVARASGKTQEAFEELLTAMVWLFEQSLTRKTIKPAQTRQDALSLAALCVGGMALARAMPGSDLADNVRQAALQTAERIITP